MISYTSWSIQLSDEVNDSSGEYKFANTSELNAFIETKMDKIVQQINEENTDRLTRFELDANKQRAIYDAHVKKKPKISSSGSNEAVTEWHDKARQLEGIALGVERQLDHYKRRLEKESPDHIKRQARHRVKQAHAVKYKLYQDHKSAAVFEKYTNEFDSLNKKLGASLKGNGSTQDVDRLFSSMESLIKKIENSSHFEKTSSQSEKKQIGVMKKQIEEYRSRDRDSGLEL